MSSCKLTICFEEPFWVGLVEVENEGDYRVARYVFGSEPSEPEIEQFIHDRWRSLHFTADMKVEKIGGTKKINHKRMQRVIEKEIAANASRGTKAQQAIALQREAQAAESKEKTKARREVEKEARFQQKQQKRKQKHRGH